MFFTKSQLSDFQVLDCSMECSGTKLFITLIVQVIVLGLMLLVGCVLNMNSWFWHPEIIISKSEMFSSNLA